MLTSTFEIQIKKASQSKLASVDFQHLVFGRIFSDHMLLAEYADSQWQSANITPYDKISFSPSLMALHYGQAIFEGLKAYRQEDGQVVVFRPYDNYLRMNRSAERMCMPEIPEEIFMNGLRKLLQLDSNWVPGAEGSSLYIRPLLFASDEFIGMKPSEKYTFIIFTGPVAAYYNEPVKLKIENHYVRAVEGGTGYAKTAGNYAASMYATQLANREGYHQILWTDGKEHRHLEEVGTMNIMFKINNKIITPALGDTVLDGITRKSILQIARDWGYETEERKITVNELIEAIQQGQLEEAFGAGTAATVSPVQSIAYQDQDYTLAPLSEESFAMKAKKHLMGICKGINPDLHQWMFKISC